MAKTGFLYYYKLNDGTTYIGKDENSDPFNRARDHFYNAISNKFESAYFPPKFQYSSSSGQLRLVDTSPSVMEKHWAELMQYESFKEMSKTFIEEDYDIENIIKQIKDNIKYTWKLSSTGSSYDVFLLRKRIGYLLQHSQNPYDKTLNKMKQQEIKYHFKQKISNKDIKKIGISCWFIKRYREHDDFFNTKIKSNGLTYNLHDTINKIEELPNSLKDIRLTEFLLTAVQLSDVKQMLLSLNRQIGDELPLYKQIWKQISEPLKNNPNLTKLQQNVDKTTIEQLDEEIKKLKKDKIIQKNTIQNLIYFFQNPSTDYKEVTGNVTVDLQSSTNKLFNNFFYEHSGNAIEYWSKYGGIDWTEKMLREGFKYTVITSGALEEQKEEWEMEEINESIIETLI